MPPPQPRGSFAGRLSRALDNSLSLLHRSKFKFFILGATSNVYTVTLSTTPSCTCPDPMTPCKHILFVYIRVLSLSTDYALLRRRTLSPSVLFVLLHSATSPDSYASERLRKCFLGLHKIDDDDDDNGDNDKDKDDGNGNGFEDGSTCPVCLDEMRKDDGKKVVVCATCKNPIHESCLMAWKDESSRTCVMCRARWGKIGEQEQEQEEREYINLSAYIDEGNNMGNVDNGQED